MLNVSCTGHKEQKHHVVGNFKARKVAIEFGFCCAVMILACLLTSIQKFSSRCSFFPSTWRESVIWLCSVTTYLQ